MRIEINAGGLGGVLAVHDYLNDIDILTQKSNSVIASFATVKNAICNVTGGLGNLSEAVSMLNDRMQRDEQDKIYLYEVKNESQTFLDLAKEVDRNVEKMLNQSRKQFFAQNPWLKPQPAVEKWLDEAWGWICGTANKVVNDVVDSIKGFTDWYKNLVINQTEAIKKAWNWTKDTLSKAWNWCKDFYKEHKKEIDTALIIIGAVASVAAVIASGGGALIPILTALGCSSGTAAAISGTVATIAVVSKISSSAMNVVDIWCEIEDDSFQKWKKRLNITSSLSNGIYSIGSLWNKVHKISPSETKAMMKNALFGNEGRGVFAGTKYTTTLSDYYSSTTESSKYYSVPTENGGKIYVSTQPVNANDIKEIVYNNPNEKFVVLTGTHGGELGELGYSGSNGTFSYTYSLGEGTGAMNPKFFWAEDYNNLKSLSNVDIVDIRTYVDYTNTPSGQIYNIFDKPYFSELFSGEKSVLCAWCYSERSDFVKEVLNIL